MRGLLADINVHGLVELLVQKMMAPPWTEIWNHLELSLVYFDEVGLSATSSDLEIWLRCQDEQLVFITNNRTDKSPDSLESAIRVHNSPDSLPVFTIANLDRLRLNRVYAELVLEQMYEYLFRIDSVRGTGRLYLP